jgi:hypothetical protein
LGFKAQIAENLLFMGKEVELWLIGRNSCGSAEDVELLVAAATRAVFSVLPLVTPPMIIPTTLVTSPSTPPTTAVASLTILLTSLKILATIPATPLKTTDTCVGVSAVAGAAFV